MTSYLLDTNIVSEYSRPEPNLLVVNLFRAVPPETLFVSAITLGELRQGVEALPVGQRRQRLEVWLACELPVWFAPNTLPVTSGVADRWGRLAIVAKRRGHTLSTPDGLIAATALEHGLTLVTRNIKDFAGLDLALLNPWD